MSDPTSVLSFLKAHGYQSSARAMEEELQQRKLEGSREAVLSHDGSDQLAGVDAMEVSHFVHSQGMDAGRSAGGAVLSWGIPDGEPSKVVRQYNELEEFISHCLDLYKTELSGVRFPIFANCYVDLVHMGASEFARQLMALWGKQHTEHYPQEVDALRAVTDADQLGQNEFVQLVRTHRYAVSMSDAGSRLLNNFLVNCNLNVIFFVMNTRVAIRVTHRPPSSIFQVATCGPTTALPPMGGSEQATPASPPVQWAALPSQQIVAAAEQSAPRPGAAGADAGGPSHGPKELLLPSQLRAAGPTPGQNQSLLLQVILRPLDINRLQPYGITPASADRKERAFVADPQEPSVLLASFHNLHHQTTCMQFTRQASAIAVGSEDRTVKVWQLAPGQLGGQRRAQGGGNHMGKMDAYQDEEDEVEDAGPLRLVGHTKAVYGVSWSPEGRFLYSAGGEGCVRLWDMAQHKRPELVKYTAHKSPVWAVACSPVGYYFATAAQDRTARLFSTDRTEPLRIMAGHLGDVNCVSFHPNSNYLATGSTDKTVRLWDLQTGNCVRVLTGHTTAITCVAVSPVGRYVAAGSNDRNIRVWDISTGAQVAHHRGHQASVTSLDFSADGGFVASGSVDGTVRTWNIKACPPSTGHTKTKDPTQCCKAFLTQETSIYTVTFTQQNLLLAAGESHAKPNAEDTLQQGA